MNSILQWYRQANPNDPASDEEIILDYGSRYPLEQLPEDFVADFNRVSQAQRVEGSSLAGEFGKGLSRGWDTLIATGAGLGAIGADIAELEKPRNYLTEVFRRKQEEMAQEAPASVPTIEGAFASPSAFGQYVLGKGGELVPNVVESVALAGAGALAGSAAAPGPGTVGGGLAGLFAKGAARSAIRNYLKKNVTSSVAKELAEYEAGKLAGKALSAEATKAIKASAAYMAGIGTSIADATAQGAGYGYGVAATTPGVTRDDALTAAAISGVGGSLSAIIPIRILKGVLGESIGDQAARSYVDLYARQVPTELLAASSGLGAAEFFNILGEKYADPAKRDSGLNQEDWSRLLNAAAMGGMAGTPSAAIRAIRGVKPPEPVLPPPLPKVPPLLPPPLQGAIDGLKPAEKKGLQDQGIDPNAITPPKEKVNSADLLGIAKDVVNRYGQLKELPSRAAAIYPILKKLTATAETGADATTLGNIAALLNLELDDTVTVMPRMYAYVERPKGKPVAPKAVNAPAPPKAPEPGMTAEEITVVYPQTLTAEQEAVWRGIAERDVANQLSNSLRTYLDTLPPPLRARYEIIKKEVANAIEVRKEPEGVPGQRQGDGQGVRPEGQDRPQPPVIAKEGDQAGAGGSLPKEAPVVVAEPEAPLKITVEDFPDGIKIAGISVGKAFRGRGVATAAIKQVLARSEAEKKPVYLTASAESAEAQPKLNRLYERLGFEHYRDDPLSGKPMYRYIPKSLKPKPEPPPPPPPPPAKPKPEPPPVPTSPKDWVQAVVADWTGWTTVTPENAKKLFYRELGSNPDRKSSTRALGVFESPDGKIIVTTIYNNRGEKVYMKGGGKAWEKALEQGYKPIETIRTTERFEGIYEEYTPEQWAPIREQIGNKVTAAKADVGLERTSADVGAATTATGAVTPEGLAVSETKRVGKSIGQKIVSDQPKGFTRDDINLIHDLAIKAYGGIPDLDANNNAAKEAIVDALETNPALLKRLTEVGGENTSDLLLNLVDAYDHAVRKFRNSGSTDPEALRAQVVSLVEGISPKKPGAGAQAGEAAGESRQARPVVTGPREPGTAENAAVGVHVAQRLANVGIPVQQLQANVGALANDMAQSMGSYDRARRAVTWVLSDLSAPNKTDLRVVFEEAGHALFDRESPELLQPVLRAISRLDISPAERAALERDLANAYPEGMRPEVLQEEMLMGLLSRRLADEGFNPIQSRGLVQSLVRLVKELYFKASMWVQQNLLGPQYDNPDLAVRFWRNRLEGFLAGDQETLSWINRLGGGKPSVTRQLSWSEPALSSHDTLQTFNPVYGDIDTGPILLDSVEAAALSLGGEELRFAVPAPGLPPRPYVDPAIRLNQDAAVNNETAFWRQQAADAAGIDPADLRRMFGMTGNPVKIAQLIADRASRTPGADNFNPNQRIEDFRLETNSGPSYVRAVRQLQNENARIATRKLKDEEALPKAQDTHTRIAEQVEKELDNYTDAEFMASQVKQGFRALAADQIRKERRGAQALGMIMQQARNIEGKINQPVDPATVNALKRLFTGNELESQNLFELMDMLANDEAIDFTLPASQIRQIIRQRAQLIPDYQPYRIITSGTPEGNALLATVVGFGKYYRRTMTLLGMRRMKSGESRAALEAELKGLRKQTSEQIVTGIRQVAKGAKLEEKARSDYRRILRKAIHARKDVDRIKARIEAADKALPVYRKAIDNLAAKISLTEDSTFGDGMVIRVPTSAGPDPKWENKTVNLHSAKGDVTTPAQLETWASQIAAFTALREQAARAGDTTALGVDYQNAKRQLNEIINNRFYKAALENTDHTATGLVIGPTPKKLEGSGTPVGSRLGIMVRKWVAGVQALRNQADKDYGYKVGRLYHDALGALNKGRPFLDKISHDFFITQVLDPAIGFMEKMQPTEGGNRAADLDRAFADLESWLMSNEHLRPHLSGRMADFMPVLREYIEANYEAGQFWQKQNEAAGLLVEDPKLAGKLRRAYQRGLLTTPRKFSTKFTETVNALRMSGWTGTGKDDGAYGDFANAAKLYSTDRPRLEAMLAKYFDHPVYGETVRQKFLYALANLPEESPFQSPHQDTAGSTYTLDGQTVARAYEDAKGDVVKMFELLYDENNGHGPVGQYVQDSLMTLAEIFHTANQAHRKMESKGAADVRTFKELIPNAMIDARMFDHWPSEWFSYHKFDRNENARMAERIAGQQAFGRDTANLAADYETLMSEVEVYTGLLKTVLDQAMQITPSGRKKAIDETAAKILDKDITPGLQKFKTGKERLDFLRKMHDRAPGLRSFLPEFADYFDRHNQDVGSLRWGVRVAQALAGVMVNQPSSAIAQLATMFDVPVQWGASPTMLNVTRRIIQLTAKDAGGSLAQGLGWQFLKLAPYEQRFNQLGLNDAEVARRFADAMDTLEGEQHNRKAQIARVLRDVQGFTVNRLGEKAQYTALRPLAPFTQGVLSVNRALTVAIWELADRYVTRAAEYLRANPGTDRITADNLKLRGLDKDSFEKFQKSLAGYGLEVGDMARGAIKRADSGDRTILTDTELQRLYSLGLNEISLENNVATMPLASFNNKVLRFIAPLLGWGWRRTVQVAGGRLNAQDKQSLKAVSQALLGLGAAGLGGLGLSLVVDAYQEDVLGKRRNIRDLRFPTTGDDFIALQERLARVGTLGLFGEFLNGAVNVGTGQGDNRMLSADQRIVALQSIQGIQQAISALINQDFDPDYQHVVRPFFSALGGSGMLQYAQIANRALSLDNVESRTVRRINAQNWLRVTGRDLDLPVRISSRGYATPTPMTPWISRMEFSAYANDPEDFREAYRGAVAQAKEMGKPNPASYVKEAFQTRHPLRYVFTQVPTELEYRQLLNAMSDDGREDVQEAIRMFNYYGAHIGVNPFQGSTKRRSPAF